MEIIISFILFCRYVRCFLGPMEWELYIPKLVEVNFIEVLMTKSIVVGTSLGQKSGRCSSELLSSFLFALMSS